MAARMTAFPLLVRRGRLLATAVGAQLLLGGATWVVNYGWPAWFTGLVWAVEYTVVAQGRLQVLTTTAHVAVGSLALAMAVNLALWSHRLLRGPRP
jgi:cytochrome c oxidase assembly protein subunit 15